MSNFLLYFSGIPIFFFGYFLDKKGDLQKRTPDLEKFRSIEDLNELKTFRWEMEPFNDADKAFISKVFEEWNAPQTISNLLQHPDLIPEDLRFKFIHKGLTDCDEPYYNLSAILGIHSPEVLGFTAREEKKLKRLLFAHVSRTTDIRATAATQILYSYIAKEDAEDILSRMIHPNSVVRHNLFTMLVGFYGIEGVPQYLVENELKFGKAAFAGKEIYCRFLEKIETADSEEERQYAHVEMMLPKMEVFPNLKDIRIEKRIV